MDHLNRDALRQLAQTQDDPCVSLFMPTYHVEAELSQNAIRLKNLLREARHQLKEEGFRDDDIDDILLPAHILLERADAWSESSAAAENAKLPSGRSSKQSGPSSLGPCSMPSPAHYGLSPTSRLQRKSVWPISRSSVPLSPQQQALASMRS